MGSVAVRMDYDTVLLDIGEFGRWQQITQALLWIPPIFCGVHAFLFSFTGLQPSNGFRCKIPGCDGDDFKFNDFPEDKLFPKNKDGDPEYCKFYPPLNDPTGSCSHENFSNVSVKCPSNGEFAYGTFEFNETLVTKLDLVCGESYKVSLVIMMYMLGLMIGSILCGRMADKFGRKKTLMFSIICSSVGSLVGSFMPEYYSYTLSRVLTAIGAQGLFLSTFSLTLEVLGSRETVPFLPWVTYQTFFGVMIQSPFAIGMALLTLQASYTSSWFTLQWTSSVATFVQLGLWFVLPKSPRWLIASNRVTEARQMIQKAAKRNGKALTEKSLGTDLEMTVNTSDAKAPEPKTLDFKELFNPHLLKTTLILFICWPIVTVGYYGISYGMANLSNSLFMDFAMGSLIEIPSYILVLILMDIVGRKPIFSCSLLLTGASCIVVGSLDKEGELAELRRYLALVGKFFASGTIAIVYIYTAELYPTLIRSTAVGSCSVMAKLGGLASPYIALYLPTVASVASPYYVLGSLTLFGGLLALLLPETLGSKLPETMEDVDQMKRSGKKFWTCMSPCSKK